MVKRIIFLSINPKFFPAFKESLSPSPGEKNYFVVRDGLSKEDIERTITDPPYEFVQYQGDKYNYLELKKVIRFTYDEAVILSRRSQDSAVYFENFISLVKRRSKFLYILDIEGKKRKVTNKEVLFVRLRKTLKSIVRFINRFFYKLFSYVLFIVTSLLLVLLTPAVRLTSVLRLKLMKRKVNICICKRVHSNQSYIIAKGLKELGYFAYSINLTEHPFSYNHCDIDYTLSHRNRFYRFFILDVIFFYCALRFDLFLFENNGESFFVSPLWEKWDITWFFQVIELYLYEMLGKRMIFEMRDCTLYEPQKALKSTHRTLCKNCTSRRKKGLCGKKAYVRSNRIAIRNAHRILYSTIDLKFYLPPGAHWLPNAVIPEPLPEIKGINPKITVVHSATCEIMKGTALATIVVSQLQEKYPIEFRVLKGIPHKEALQIIKEADIALGQFNAGSYGNFEIECMVHGKPVIGYINPEYVKYYPSNLPIINVDEMNIEKSIYDNIEKLILDKKLRETMGMKSREYALKVHGYRPVSQRLITIIQEML